MIVVYIVQIILYLVVVPFGLGIAFTKKISDSFKTVGITYSIGFLAELSIFQVVFLLCFYLIGTQFLPVVLISAVLFVVLSAVSYIVNFKTIKSIKFPEINFGFIVFVLFVLYMVIMRNLQGVNDGDDAFVVGNALTVLTTGRMYTVDYYTGLSINEFSRHFLASSPLFISFLGKVSFIHPTVIAHRILGSMYIIIYAALVYNVGSVLFDSDERKKYRGLFASLVMLLSVWDFHSPYTASTFLLTRTWQGKAMFCEIAVPFSILMLLMIGKDLENYKRYCIMSAILCVASVAMTPGAIFMLPLLLCTGALFVSGGVKKIAPFIGIAVSMSVMAVFAVAYVLL